jgi:hypothetical protein
MNPASHRDYLKELQALDEPTKRKVLIGSSIVLTAIVVFTWLAYFNSIVVPSTAEIAAQFAAATSTSTPAVAAAAVPAAAVPAATPSVAAAATPSNNSGSDNSGSGFWSGIGSSFTAFGEGVEVTAQSFADIFTGGHITIR